MERYNYEGYRKGGGANGVALLVRRLISRNLLAFGRSHSGKTQEKPVPIS